MIKYKFNSVEEAIEDIRKGKMVVVVDDEGRENEGDLVIAAEKVEKFEQINIGYGKTYTVLQILDHIKKAANYEAPYKLIPTGPRMIPIRRVNITKAEQVLGWKPKVAFEDGIARTYGWTQKKLSKE